MERIETERLFLSPLAKEDAQALYRLTGNIEVARFMRFNTHSCLAQTETMIEEYLQLSEEGLCYPFSIMEKASGTLIGFFASKTAEEIKNECSWTLFLDQTVWGKGYATEITSKMVSVLLYQLGYNKILAYVVENNHASASVLRKNGFQIERTIAFPETSLNIWTISKT